MLVKESSELVHCNIPLRDTISCFEGFVDVERRTPVHSLAKELCFLFKLEMDVPAFSELQSCS